MVHEARHRSGTTWWIKPRALAVLGVAAAGLAVAVWLPGRGDVASATVQSRNAAQFGRSIFADDFTGGRSGQLDLNKWSLLRDDGGPVSGGASLKDGQLTVNRLLRTRHTFTDAFGHAEARIKVRRLNGVWRAFALLDANGRVPKGTISSIDGGIDPTSGRDFHTYAIDWSPESVIWSVDGRPSLRLDRQDDGGPLTLVLNLATDGRSASRMIVDFVQVFTNASAPPTAGQSSPPSPSATDPSTPPADPTPSPTTPPADPTTEPTPPPASASPTPPPATTAPAAAPWAEFTAYEVGDLVTFKGKTYRVLEAHTALPGWEPTKLPNLFAKV